MIRIKVYKASHLIIGALVAILVIVLAVVAIRYLIVGNAHPAGAGLGDEKKTVVQMTADDKSEGVAALAAAPSLYEGAKVREVVFEAPAETHRDENEHTDAQDDDFVVEVVPSRDGAPAKAAGDVRILIYHTHTHEAYRQVDSDAYVETEKWRTIDQTHSIVRVGEALALQLRAMGFDVVHDRTDHEPPTLDTAYARSLETIEKYGEGAFDVYIDLHRDAYSESTHQVLAVLAQNKSAAQVMILLGNGEGFDEKPNFSDNYLFAKTLTDRINALSPNLCRDVMVKNNRYNQHVGGKALLIEVGHNLNTLEEALNTTPYLAEALYETLTGTITPQ